jgi:hypothetical protein
VDAQSSLAKPDTIDLVARSASGDEIILCLVATEPWDPGGAQALRLQAKLKNYVGFAADGELSRRYPDALGKKITIHIETQFPLGAFERRLVDGARETWCAPEGISLTVAEGRL